MHTRKTAQLGELVVSAFDAAAQYSADPHVISLLATQAVERVVQRARRAMHRGRLLAR